MWCAFALLLAASGPATRGEPTLDISSADIALVWWSQTDDSANVRLTPRATAELERFTRNNLGRMVTTSIDGIPAVRAVVQGVIDSGWMTVTAPSPALRAVLEAVRTQRGAQDPFRSRDPK